MKQNTPIRDFTKKLRSIFSLGNGAQYAGRNQLTEEKTDYLLQVQHRLGSNERAVRKVVKWTESYEDGLITWNQLRVKISKLK